MTFLTTIDDVKLQVYRFKDLQTKDIILACTSVVLRNPRQTKHTGTVPSVQLSCWRIPQIFFINRYSQPLQM